MINTAATIPPAAEVKVHINAAETLPPDGAGAESGLSVPLYAGEAVSDSLVIDAPLERQGSQARIYKARRWGKSYAVKVYKEGWRPSAAIQAFLKNVRHRNIASALECGEYKGSYYEVYEYYSEGTLEECGALSASHIAGVIVPSVNEGLHELHRQGIIHSDIKPSNLFYADNRTRVIIGDCGISSYTNQDGKLIGPIRGTPEYTPPVKMVSNKAVMTPAFDYGSFGLVLCRMVLGRSLFSGMSETEIAAAWEAGIELPGSISGRIRPLILGLLEPDEKQRWGYNEVKRWCEGEYIPQGTVRKPKRKKEERPIIPLIFGRVGNTMLSVSSLHQLAVAIEAHWDIAGCLVKRLQLVEFIRQFDYELSSKAAALARIDDTDAAVFMLLMYTRDDPRVIVYCGRRFNTLSEYVAELAKGRDETLKKFISSGLLVSYLRFNKYEPADVDRLEQLIQRDGCSNMAAVTTICFALQGRRTIEVFGTEVSSLDELIPVLGGHTAREIDELISNDRFIAWMNRLGYEREMRKIKELFG